jgi:hypothetical protein
VPAPPPTGYDEEKIVLVIHALWVTGGRLMIWAEDQAALRRAVQRDPGRSRRRPHPYAATAAVLVDALNGTLGDRAGGAAPGDRPVLLPTRAGMPLGSPELGQPELDEPVRGAVRSQTWWVPALVYPADEALTLLRAVCPAAGRAVTGAAGPGLSGAVGPAGPDASGPVVPGAAVRHLAEVAAFATDLVDRGRLLPVVDGDLACWRPVLTGADVAWARALALALPPAAAALPTRTRTGARSTGRAGVGSGPVDGSLPAGAIVADALDRLTDAAARAALHGVRLADNRRTTGPDAVVRAWLRALTGPRRRIDADPAGLAVLDERLRDWRRDVTGGSVRACFRLVEPAAPPDPGSLFGDLSAPGGDASGGDATRWWLEFALQSAEEPSLLVDAERIWASHGGLHALGRQLDSPQETLLTELGRASRLWPELTDALRTATPTGLTLDVEGAHRFLRDGAPMLHAAGFGVLLPTWWQRPSARLGARLRASSRTAPGTVAGHSGVGLDALVDYEWQVALGDTPLTDQELHALAGLKAPLVRLRGQWVELDPKRLAAGLRLLRAGGALTVADLLHLGLGVHGDPDGLPVLEVSADGALGDLLAGRAEQHLAPVDEPPGFTGALRPYQKRGLAWLSFLQSLGLGGVLADDMGLGKTVQLLALLAADPPQAGPTLLVCPMSLVGNWQREAARFTPELRVHVHHGAERARGADFRAAAEAADLVLTTYSIAARDADALSAIDWHRIVADEAQAIKNAATRQAVAVRSLPARHRIAVTGTPVENRLADLWALMEFANPGLLGAAATFRKRYAVPIERHGDDEAAGRLRRMTGPFVLRRLKTDSSIISDLPEKLEMEVLCNLTAEQASLYQAVVDDMLEQIEHSEGMERRGLVLATMTKLKQVCNHPAQLLRDDSPLAGRSGKLARLEETVEEILAAGEQALLFTQYAGFGALLRSYLVTRFGREVLFLHGGVGKRDRDELVARFQAGAAPLFLLSLKAGGTGLTLTAANHVLHVDRWWNPAVENQATDRAFRIGQHRTVQVRTFVCAGTVEEKIAELISGKCGLAERIVGTGEQWLTELSTARLRELVRLETGAVVE